MNLAENPASVMFVPPTLRAARRLVFYAAEQAGLPFQPLSELADIEMGTSPPGSCCNSEGQGVPLLNGPTEFGLRHPTPVQWTTSPVKNAESGDLLFCVRGATTGRTSWADQRYAIGRGLAAIRGKKTRGDSVFLYHMLRDRRDDIAAGGRGSTFMNLGKDALLSLRIPQIPLQLQQIIGCLLTAIEESASEYHQWNEQLKDTAFEDMPRLVAKIEELAAKVENAKRLRHDAGNELDAANGSAASVAFSCYSDQYQPISEVADVRGGIQKQPGRVAASNPVRYLTVAHVQRNRILLDDPRFFEVSPEELGRWQLRAGDVLIIEGNGSADQIGRTALFRGEIASCVHQNHVIRIRPQREHLEPEYLNSFLNSPSGQEEVQSRSRTTSGLRSLSVGRIKDIHIPIPPLPEQRRIVAYLDELQAKVDCVKAMQAQTQAELDALLPSILDKAFKGEL